AIGRAAVGNLRLLLRPIPVLLHFAVLKAEQIVGVVLVALARVGRILPLAFPDHDDVVAFAERNRRLWIELWRDRDRLAAAAEELLEPGASGLNVDVVLNVIFSLVLRRQLHVARLNHFTPPVE